LAQWTMHLRGRGTWNMHIHHCSFVAPFT
jgi:hypothetical protein